MSAVGETHRPPGWLTHLATRARTVPAGWISQLLPPEGGGRRASAVLMLFGPAPDDPCRTSLVLTQRADTLRNHAGQVSFPGGAREEGDPDLVATALREAEEEIGLAPEQVQLLGALAPVRTFVTGYVIFPYVGLIEPGNEWTPSPGEVDVVLELALRDLAAGFGVRPLTRRGITFETDTYVVGDHLIWGATARILGDLLARLAPLLARA